MIKQELIDKTTKQGLIDKLEELIATNDILLSQTVMSAVNCENILKPYMLAIKYAEQREEIIASLKKALELACEQLNFCVNPRERFYNPDSECEETIDYCDYDESYCSDCRKRYFIRLAEDKLKEEEKM